MAFFYSLLLEDFSPVELNNTLGPAKSQGISHFICVEITYKLWKADYLFRALLPTVLLFFIHCKVHFLTRCKTGTRQEKDPP